MQDDAMQVQDGRSGLATVAAYACFESIQANAVVAEADALGFGVCYCCCCCWPNPMQGRDRNSQRWARHVPGRWRNGGGGRVGGVERGMQSGGMGWDGDGQDGLGWRRSRCGANVTNNLSPVMTAAGKGVGCVGAGGSRLSYAIRMDANGCGYVPDSVHAEWAAGPKSHRWGMDGEQTPSRASVGGLRAPMQPALWVVP